MERDREATEKRLLDAIRDIIAEQGLEKIGINAVSAQSGVSKILIYRYFGSLDGLIAAYIRKNDFWITSSTPEITSLEELIPFTKQLFRQYIDHLRSNPVLRKLCRWELSCSNEMITALRNQREQSGKRMIEMASKITGHTNDEMAALSTLITATGTYLAMLADTYGNYNGINLNTDAGWEVIHREVERLIDLTITQTSAK